METRYSATSQLIRDGQELGYKGEELQQYVREQKADEERVRREHKAEELAKIELKERIR